MKMPRANRYILPGHIYHLTHRCHNGSFLLKFAVQRNEYRKRLRMALKQFNMDLLTYSLTSNHTHMLVTSETDQAVSGMMQKLEGEFAEWYNLKKKRQGAFWSGRYHSTMVEGGTYLWNCMKYIDLNMVRAGQVEHPRQWEWCGYRELMGEKNRYRITKINRVLELNGGVGLDSFRNNYKVSINEAIESRSLQRDPRWTESIAVGSEGFVLSIEEQITGRRKLKIESNSAGDWTIREEEAPYG